MKMYIYNNKTNKQSVVAEPPPASPRKERKAKNRSEKQQS